MPEDAPLKMACHFIPPVQAATLTYGSCKSPRLMQKPARLGDYEAQWSFCGDLVRRARRLRRSARMWRRTNSRFTDIQSNHRAPSTNGKGSCARFPNLRIFARIWSGLSAHPHHVDHPHKNNAEWILAKFQRVWSRRAHRAIQCAVPDGEKNAPSTRRRGPSSRPSCKSLRCEDPTSNQQSEQLPTYNAYSIDGMSPRPLVYVNYGIPKTMSSWSVWGFRSKEDRHRQVFFISWRRYQPKVAAEHGAVGCLIYSDPHEDGLSKAMVFPAGVGARKMERSAAAFADMRFIRRSLTPGVGATKDAKRLKVEEAPTITKIPVLPISYGDAQPLLQRSVVPCTRRVARRTRITYHVGPDSDSAPEIKSNGTSSRSTT